MGQPRDSLEFAMLCEELQELEGRRLASNGVPASHDGERLAHVEQRLLELLTIVLPETDRRRFVRLVTNVLVYVVAGGTKMAGILADIGPGGVFVQTLCIGDRGDVVDLEIVPTWGATAPTATVRGMVAWASRGETPSRVGLGIAFRVTDQTRSNQARRFVFDLLRTRHVQR